MKIQKSKDQTPSGLTRDLERIWTLDNSLTDYKKYQNYGLLFKKKVTFYKFPILKIPLLFKSNDVVRSIRTMKT